MRLQIVILYILCGSLSAQVFVETNRFGNGIDDHELLSNPQAIDHSALGIIYVADTGNNLVRLFKSNGVFIESIGGFGFADDQFDMPTDIWARSIVNIYVADYNNQRLQRYDRQMNFISSLLDNEALDQQFQFGEVSSCAVTAQNDLFLLDHRDFKVIKFNRSGNAEHAFGQLESDHGELINPQQLDIWQGDKLIVSDADLPGIYIFDLFGNFIRTISDKRFKHPHGLAVSSEMIFLADPVAGAIFSISPESGEVNQIKSGLPFKHPMDITVISEKQKRTLYILDKNQIITGSLEFK